MRRCRLQPDRGPVVSLLQGDSANDRVAQVLCGLEGDGAGATVEGQLGGQSVVNLGDLTGGELDVDHGR